MNKSGYNYGQYKNIRKAGFTVVYGIPAFLWLMLFSVFFRFSYFAKVSFCEIIYRDKSALSDGSVCLKKTDPVRD